MKVALTFDLDFTDYLTGDSISDELEASWPIFLDLCKSIPGLKSTWFVRIDAQMQGLYGSSDYVFSAHREKMEWLRANGHEIGWHFHSYRKIVDGWKQNTDDDDICNELESVFPIVEKNQLKILRMGWAYHSNTTLRTVSDLGIWLDCSAFPRPTYSWDNPHRDWSQTSQKAYFPSISNYQVSGESNLPILELPMSTVVLGAANDTDENVVRYINPTYFHEKFTEAIGKYVGDTLNLIAHPYELLPNSKGHALMSFSSEIMRQNLDWLGEMGYEFVTITELVKSQRKSFSN